MLADTNQLVHKQMPCSLTHAPVLTVACKKKKAVTFLELVEWFLGRMPEAGAGTVPANVVPVNSRLFSLAAHTPLYFLIRGTPGRCSGHTADG